MRKEEGILKKDLQLVKVPPHFHVGQNADGARDEKRQGDGEVERNDQRRVQEGEEEIVTWRFGADV